MLRIIAFLLIATPVYAQGIPCMNAQKYLKTLTDKDMSPQMIGKDAGGENVVIFANPDTGEFQALVEAKGAPKGDICVFVTGTDFALAPQGQGA